MRVISTSVSARLSPKSAFLNHKFSIANMSHESVWYSRPRQFGKGARSWYDNSFDLIESFLAWFVGVTKSKKH